MDSLPDNWCTIESDPGVFTELITNIGVKDVQVEEIYMLDKALFDEIKPVYGLIFLFKWRKEEDDRKIDLDSDLFFANQVINNACATQAILSILLNCEDIDIGPELSGFKEFTKEFPSEMKGLAISNSDLIRRVHNSFARPEPIVTERTRESGEDDDVYHFISYLECRGNLYELDGLKQGPINLGPCTKENWLETVTPIIQKRIERYSNSEIRFNLMAVVKDRESTLLMKLEDAEKRLRALKGEGGSGKSGVDSMEVDQGGDAMEVDSAGMRDPNQIALAEKEIAEIKNLIEKEKEKKESWKIENIRRKHNYLPFLVNFLKILAKKGALQHLVDSSKQEKS